MRGSSHILGVFILGLAVASLTACKSGGTTSTANTVVPLAFTLHLGFGPKQLQFSWTALSGTGEYRLLQSPDGTSGFTQVGNDLPASTTSTTLDIAVHLYNWAARYALDACTAAGCTRSNEISPSAGMLQAIGYVKASNTGGGTIFPSFVTGDVFGSSVALSSDGNTLVVGAPGEWSEATGINGNQADNSNPEAGAVYIFTRSGSTWSQQAYIKASNAKGGFLGEGDRFGSSVALSNDGNTLAVGAPMEDSAATGINGNQADNSALSAGAVYLFIRNDSTWSQQAYMKASNTGGADEFGFSLSLSSDGNTLAVGAPGESAATGINGNQADNSAFGAGAVYLFTRNSSTWSQQAYIKASNAGASDEFGNSLALSSDGNTLAVGAPGESSAATGINGDQADNSAVDAGAAYVFTRSGNIWSQQAYIKASNTRGGFGPPFSPLGEGDHFGGSVSLSGDGNTLAVGASGQTSASLGAGSAYVFTRGGNVWSQQAFFRGSNTEGTIPPTLLPGDRFGFPVVLSGDGKMLAVGAEGEASAATGINGNQADNSAPSAGAVYVFTGSGGNWLQQAYVKASNTEAGDAFGSSVALSNDGTTLAVGAASEDSSATGINGDQTDNSAFQAGAVYLY